MRKIGGLLLFAFLLAIGLANAQNQGHTTEFEFTENAPSDLRRTMQNNAEAIFKSINYAYATQKSSLTISGNNATREAINMLQDIWKTSHFYCTKTKITAKVERSGTESGFLVNGVSLFMEQGATDKDKNQDFVLEFAHDGKINSVRNALYIKQNSVTDLRRRHIILNLLENFRTAYNRKDLLFLYNMFNNDALTIDGKSMMRTSGRGDSPMPITSNFDNIVHAKNKYMQNLRNAFNQNEYINITFDEISVAQHDEKKNIYGVTLRQNWNSTSYKDEGWLFLLIDFDIEDTPQILVRVWQPISVPENEVFSLSDFPIR